jgi:hypothetical protein
LDFDEQYLEAIRKPNALDKITDSMTWFYRLFGRYIRHIGEADKSEAVARTAVQRSQALTAYKPTNLQKCLADGGCITDVSSD